MRRGQIGDMHVQTSAGTLAVALLSGTVDNALGGATRMGGQAVDARRAYPRFSPTALSGQLGGVDMRKNA